ncbi:hypothetical protein PTSG_12890, partial [Salpingoeca rosetta]
MSRNIRQRRGARALVASLLLLLLLTLTASSSLAVAQPCMNSDEPASGQAGTRVTIYGSNLLGQVGTAITSVRLAGVPAEIVEGTSQSQVVVIAAEGTAGEGDVVLEANTGATAVSPNAWQYINPGRIDSVGPASGQVGTLVTIRGYELLGGGDSPINVTLGGKQATVVLYNSTHLVARAPARDPGLSHVTIRSNTGAVVTANDAFTYLNQSSIAGVNPNTGQLGTVVTILGTRLFGGGSAVAEVQLAGTSAAILRATDTEIVVVAPDHGPETGDVLVTADTGATTTSTGGFTFAERGAVATVSPTSGQHGTLVTIRGDRLRGSGSAVVNVTLAGRTATVLEENSTTVIVAAGAGAETAVAGDVVLTADTGAEVTRSGVFSYVAAGEITDVTPASGGAGTRVTVLGRDLCGGGSSVVRVLLAGFEADVVSGGCARVEATARDFGMVLSGPVLLISDTGAMVESSGDAWTYLAEGRITSVSPSAGQDGTEVHIRGELLLGGGTSASRVTLAGVAAFVLTSNETDVVVRAFPGTSSGDVVIVGDTGVSVRLTNAWTYSVIESVEPAFGQRGTVVTLSGRALLGGEGDVSRVLLGSVEVSAILRNSSDEVVVVAGDRTVFADAVGHVEIELASGRQVVLRDAWTYRRAGSIASVVPASGHFGTVVRIGGSRLLGHGQSLVGATLAGVAAEVVSASNTDVVLVANASSSARSGNVVLIADTGATVVLEDGTSGLAEWTYVAPGVISEVEPSFGQVDTRVTVRGSGLRGGAASTARVVLAGVEATQVVSDSDSEIVVVAGAIAGGVSRANGSVRVFGSTGAEVSGSGLFSYVARGVISDVEPSSGHGGTLVTIRGERLDGSGGSVARVRLAGVWTSVILRQNSSEVVVAAEASSGAVAGGDVLLESASGATVEAAGRFSYVAPGVVSAVEPGSGSAGTVVTVRGSGLLGGGGAAAAVRLSGVEAQQVLWSNESVVVAVAGAGSNVTGDVEITADTGAVVRGLASSGRGFTYVVAGVIEAVQPSSGRVGTVVTLSGNGLLGGGSAAGQVSLGGVPCEVLTSGALEVVVRVGAGGVGGAVGDAVVVADTGAEVRKAAAWTQVDAGAIDSVTPGSGQAGTLVNVTGRVLLGGGSRIVEVILGGTAASAVVDGDQETFVTVVANRSASAGDGRVVVRADTGAEVSLDAAWNYTDVPTVESTYPSSAAAGSRIMFVISHLIQPGDSLAVVTVAGQSAAFSAINATHVFVTLPSSSAVGDTTVQFTSARGTLLAATVTVSPSPFVSSITPNTGQLGTVVSLAGSDLLGGADDVQAVLFGTTPAVVQSAADTLIVVEAPFSASNTTVDVVIVTGLGAAFVQSDAFAYLRPASVASVIPSSGQVGTIVSIDGSGFNDTASAVERVLLGDTPATLLAASDTSIVFRVTNVSHELLDVTLVTGTGVRHVLASSFRAYSPGVIADVTPSSGREGTEVVVYGTHLRAHSPAVTNVSFGSYPARIVRETDYFVSVVLTQAPATSELVDVSLTTTFGAVTTKRDAFMFVPRGNVTAVSPSSGVGGTRVVIQGSNLLGGGTRIISVTLAGVDATLVHYNNTVIEVVARAGDPGLGDVIISSNTGSVTVLDNAWAYVPVGEIHAVLPAQGQAYARVTVVGLGLFSGAPGLERVRLAGEDVLRIVSASDSKVVVIAPAVPAATTGNVELVSTTGAKVTRTAGFSFVDPANVTAVTPSSGQLGTRVTLAGSDLLCGDSALASVRIGGQETAILYASSEQVIARVNTTLEPGMYQLTVTAASGANYTAAPHQFEVLAQGAIDAVQPAAAQADAFVTIRGRGLFGGAASLATVSLGSPAVTATIVSQSSSVVVVQVPRVPYAAGAAPITLTAASGALVSNATAFELLEPGVITSVAPSSGQEGTLVTIAGERLLAGSDSLDVVYIANTSAVQVLLATDTRVVARAAAGPLVVDDVVLVGAAGGRVVAPDAWHRLAAGQIATVTPTIGQEGTFVNVTGTNLLAHSDGLASASLAGTPADVIAATPQLVQLRARVSSPRTGPVVLQASSGAVVDSRGVANFTSAQAGRIDTVAPAVGRAGTFVTLVGTNLLGHAASLSSCVVAEDALAAIVDANNTRVVVRLPEGPAPGLVNITLQATSGALVHRAHAFEYVGEGAISTVLPASGQKGTRVTIRGTALLGAGDHATSITLAGAVTTRVLSSNDTTIVVEAPAGAAQGLGAVSVEANTGAVVSQEDAFAFIEPGQITLFSPSSGQYGTWVNITGQNLLGGGSTAADVLFGGFSADEVAFASPFMVRARIGQQVPSPGPINVTIVADTGARVTSEGAFTVTSSSTIASVSPALGQRGTRVTISGQNLFGAGPARIAAVHLASVSAVVLNGSSDTQVIVQAQASPVAVANATVTVEAASGALTVAPASWSYIAPGAIASVTPAMGQAGTRVTITGTNLLGGAPALALVSIAGSPAQVVSQSNTRVVVRAGAAAPGLGDVVLEALSGTLVEQTSAFTYTNMSEITSVSPSVGQEGTLVTIRGTRLRGGANRVANVTLAGVLATTLSEDDTTVVVRASFSFSAMSGPVVVMSDSGARTQAPQPFSYLEPPSVVSIAPSTGQEGTRLTITGLRLHNGGSAVVSASLGAFNASVVSSNDTEVVIRAGAGPSTQTAVDIVLQSDTGSITRGATPWTFSPPGSIAIVDPTTGQQGALVRITGTNLCGGGSSIARVRLANVEAEILSQTSCGLLEVRAGAYGAPVTGSIELESDTGALVTKADAWTYVTSGFISSVTPAAGQSGELVSILGSNLFGGASTASQVTFGGVPATIINAGPQSGQPNLGDVVITGTSGVVIRAVDAFTYSTVDRVFPSSGQGGTRVTISGVALLGDNTQLERVELAGISAASIISFNSTQVVCVARAAGVSQAQPGQVVLVATTQEITSTGTADWTYQPPGAIASVNPARGQRGTLITVRGSTLLGYGERLVQVTVANVTATRIINATNSVAVVEAGLRTAGATGNVVLVADTGATITALAAFTYADAPVLAAVSPSSGQLGTHVTVTGQNLLMGSDSLRSVSIANESATILSQNDTHVVVRAPRSSPKTGLVRLVSSEFASVTGLSFTFLEEGVVNTVSPSSGQGGTRVTLTGERMFGGASGIAAVELAGVPVQEIVSSNTTHAVVIASDASAVAPAAVTVIANSGALVTSADPGAWQYLTPGAITSVDPDMGQVGTRITITGQRLLGGGTSIASVRLGTAGARVVSGSSTTVVAVVPSGAAGVRDVHVVANTLATTTLWTGFTFLEEGVIDSLQPSSGRLGTRVTIHGLRLLGGSDALQQILFGTVPATIIDFNTTTVEAFAPAMAAGTSNVTLVSDTGAVVRSVDGAWTQVDAGQILSVEPAAGIPTALVTIRGQDLLGIGTIAQQVTLGGSLAEVQQSNATVVIVRAGVRPAVPDSAVTVVADTGDTVSADSVWTFHPLPNITSVAPANGQQGTRVTITGSDLITGGVRVASVQLAGVTVSEVLSQSPDSLVVIAGPSSTSVSGAATITLTSGASFASSQSFEYLAPADISSVSPGSGTLGTVITVSGSHLLGGGTTVVAARIGDDAAERVLFANDSRVVFKAGNADTPSANRTVLLTADTGAFVSVSSAFSYITPASVLSVSPSSGTQGTRVTISGQRLFSDGSYLTEVLLAGVRAQILNMTEVQVVVACGFANQTSGPVVLVSNTGGRIEQAQFSIIKPPVLLAASPDSGQEGTHVILYGERLRAGGNAITQVTLNGVAATIVDETNVFVRVIAQDGPVGRGPIHLTANTGGVVQSTVAWEYLTKAVIDTVAPSSGQLGTLVTIQGSNLLGGGTEVIRVILAGTDATILSQNNTHIVVRTSRGTGLPTQGDVVVISDELSRVVAEDAFAYIAPGDVDGVMPSQGSFGTRVTIVGTNLLGGGSSVSLVELAGVEAQVESATAGQVVVIAQASNATSVGDVVLHSDTGAVVVQYDAWQYVTPGRILTVTPMSGQGGTYVDIVGTGLLSGSRDAGAVHLSGVAAVVLSANDTHVRARAGEGVPGLGDVVVTSADGAPVVAADAWTYTAAGNISGIAPVSGQEGTHVTIRGVALRGAGALVHRVLLGDSEADVLFENDTLVVVRAGHGAAGVVHVVLESSSGALVSADNAFTYLERGEVAAVSPTSGQLGTLVTITGARLLGGGSSIRTATLSGVSTEVVGATASTVVVRVTSSFASMTTGDVMLVSDTYAVVRGSGLWTGLPDGTIADVAPSAGVVGTLVTVRGANLLGYAAGLDEVTLAGVNATIVSANASVVVVAAGSSLSAVTGGVVLVATSGATVSASGAWSYVAPGQITRVRPASGQVGTRVTIEGTGLRAAASAVATVLLGDLTSTVLTSNDTTVVAVCPDGPASGVPERVKVVGVSGGFTLAESQFTFLEKGVIADVSPEIGQVGTRLVVSGERLLGGGARVTRAEIGGAVAEIESSNATTVVLVAGASSAGAADVVLVADTGATVRLDAGFTYLEEGVIEQISPRGGQEGTLVTIEGERLLGGGAALSRVLLAGQPVLHVMSASDTLVVVRAGAGMPGTGDVIVESTSGSRVTLPGGWMYFVPSSIADVQPSSGQVGTVVDISGSNLLGVANGTAVAQVWLDGTAVSSILIGDRQDLVRVVAARNTSMGVLGSVVVEADSGALASVDGRWTYLLEGVILGVVPAYGQVGTRVTISGARLLGGGNTAVNVTLDGTPASVLSWGPEQVVVRAERNSSAEVGGMVSVVSDTGAIVSGASLFAYRTEGHIDQVEPSTGQAGTIVTITGLRLRGHGVVVDRVLLGGAEAGVLSESDTAVVVRVPDASAGVVDVVIVADTGATTTSTGGFTFAERGVVATVSPTSGQHGTLVTIRGDRLRGSGSAVVNVTLAGRTATVLEENSTTVIVAAGAGAETAVAGDVVLTADTGAEVTRSGVFSYVAAGEITDVTPASGGAGTRVTVLGRDLCGGGSSVVRVLLAGFEADVVSGGCARVEATARDFGMVLSGPVLLISDTGAMVESSGDAWTYLAEGRITSVSPSAGQDGTEVHIRGELLLGGGTSASRVTLAGVAAFVLTSNETDVVVRAFPGTSSGDVVIVGDTGVSVRLTNAWTYSVIESVEPAFGQRGTVVTLSGRALLGGEGDVSRVLLGSVEVSAILRNSSDEVVVVAGDRTVFADAVGHVEIELASGRQVVLRDAWTYRRAGSIASVVPASGHFGTVVRIGGSRLLGHGQSLVGATLAGVAAEVVSASNTDVVLVANASSSARSGNVVLIADTGATVVLEDGTSGLAEWTYVAPGVISEVEPSFGQVDTRVTVRGSGLRGGAASTARVVLAGVEATQVVSDSDSEIVVVAGAIAGGVSRANGSVRVFGSTGAEVSGSGLFSYVARGVISDVEPSSGHGGTLVTIRGERLDGSGGSVARVRLAGVWTSVILRQNSSEVVVAAEASSGAVAGGDVLLESASGATVEAAGRFSYVAPGVVSAVEPGSGSAGTVVTVRGSGLLGGGGAAAAVRLSGVEAQQVLWSNESVVVAVAGAGSNVTGDVEITADTGAVVRGLASSGRGFTYVVAGVIEAVQPSSGRVGTVVTLSGNGLLGGGSAAGQVSLGGVPCEVLTSGALEVVVRVGAGGVGGAVGDAVVVADTGAEVRKAAAWTQVDAGAIDSVTPGRIVEVILGGTAASAVVDGDQETFVTVVANRSASAGDGRVVVRADTGAEVSLDAAWNYTDVPVITDVTPSSGQQGTVVTVSGNNLLGGGSQVVSGSLSGVAVSEVLSSSDTRVVVVASALNTSSTGGVVLSADSGATVTLSQAWTYLEPAVITGVEPSSGLLGTLVTISGTGLLGGGNRTATAWFGATEAESVEASSDSVVVVRVGPSAPSLVQVRLQSDSGAWVRLEDAFQVLPAGVVEAVSPAYGQAGTRVTITGHTLLADGVNLTQVRLAGVEAEIESANATQVVVVAAHASAGVGDVVLVADTLGRVEAAGAWEYRRRGQISSITPTSGHEGTEVLILGQDLLGHGEDLVQVRLGGVVARLLDRNNFFARVVAGRGSPAGPVDVRLTADTGAVVEQADLWTYVAQAVISSVTPLTGQAGTLVTIRGSNLLAGAASVSEVRLAGVSATIVSFNESVVIARAAQPPASAPAGGINVTTSSGAFYGGPAGVVWTYMDAGDINIVMPSRGSFGTRVTIVGTNLLGGGSSVSLVELAGVEAQVESATAGQVVVIAQASNATSVGDVVLHSDTGAVVVQYDAWQYVTPGRILTVTPMSGQGGTYVDIVGTGLLSGSRDAGAVHLSGVAAVVLSANDTHVRARAGEGVPGLGDVVVTSADGAPVVAADAWTYTAAGNISGIAPVSGQEGTHVTIRG